MYCVLWAGGLHTCNKVLELELEYFDKFIYGNYCEINRHMAHMTVCTPGIAFTVLLIDVSNSDSSFFNYLLVRDQLDYIRCRFIAYRWSSTIRS